MKKNKAGDIKFAKHMLRSLEFIIQNPVFESAAEVRALKRIRTRLKKAIKNGTL